jgi:hypothetical protein
MKRGIKTVRCRCLGILACEYNRNFNCGVIAFITMAVLQGEV